MTDSETLHFLAGEVNGMRMVIMALVNSHSDPQALQVHLERLTELQVALTTPMPVTESFVTGQDRTTEVFRARIAEIIAGKTKTLRHCMLRLSGS
jgi:hypothetical protein